MKSNIHPTYYPNAKVNCACGETFEAGSTQKTIQVDICSACHPFFTGEMKYVDTQGRVERFEAMRKKAEALSGKVTSKKKAIQEEADEAKQPQSLKEMMQVVKDSQ